MKVDDQSGNAFCSANHIKGNATTTSTTTTTTVTYNIVENDDLNDDNESKYSHANNSKDNEVDDYHKTAYGQADNNSNTSVKDCKKERLQPDRLHMKKLCTMTNI